MQLSQGIMQLSRPLEVRNPADVSAFYCDWIQHPTRPEVACMIVPENETIPVHVQADGDLLAETLAPFSGAELSAEEIAGLIGAVQAYAGQRISVAALVQSTSWGQWVMTHEQALAGGWVE